MNGQVGWKQAEMERRWLVSDPPPPEEAQIMEWGGEGWAGNDGSASEILVRRLLVGETWQSKISIQKRSEPEKLLCCEGTEMRQPKLQLHGNVFFFLFHIEVTQHDIVWYPRPEGLRTTNQPTQPFG